MSGPKPMAAVRRHLASLLLLAAQGFAAPGAGAETVAADADNAERLSAVELTALAARYEHAEGVPLDLAKAISLYCLAAKKAHANALYALGWIYANGRGMARDDGLARHFFELAAGQGHEQASEMLRYVAADAVPAISPCPGQATADSGDGNAPPPDYPRGPVSELVHKLAPRYGVDPLLVLAIIRVESDFNVRAVSPKNAQGLMQLTPDTARRFKVRNSFDPEENIKGGLAYLQWLLAFFQGNVPLVLAAYNAGEGAVTNHKGIPPYQETRNYVRKITSLYRKTEHPFKKGATLATFLEQRQIVTSY